jgi:hypothetical protein
VLRSGGGAGVFEGSRSGSGGGGTSAAGWASGGGSFVAWEVGVQAPSRHSHAMPAAGAPQSSGFLQEATFCTTADDTGALKGSVSGGGGGWLGRLLPEAHASPTRLASSKVGWGRRVIAPIFAGIRPAGTPGFEFANLAVVSALSGTCQR